MAYTRKNAPPKKKVRKAIVTITEASATEPVNISSTIPAASSSSSTSPPTIKSPTTPSSSSTSHLTVKSPVTPSPSATPSSSHSFSPSKTETKSPTAQPLSSASVVNTLSSSSLSSRTVLHESKSPTTSPTAQTLSSSSSSSSLNATAPSTPPHINESKSPRSPSPAPTSPDAKEYVLPDFLNQALNETQRQCLTKIIHKHQTTIEENDKQLKIIKTNTSDHKSYKAALTSHKTYKKQLNDYKAALEKANAEFKLHSGLSQFMTKTIPDALQAALLRAATATLNRLIREKHIKGKVYGKSSDFIKFVERFGEIVNIDEEKLLNSSPLIDASNYLSLKPTPNYLTSYNHVKNLTENCIKSKSKDTIGELQTELNKINTCFQNEEPFLFLCIRFILHETPYIRKGIKKNRDEAIDEYHSFLPEDINIYVMEQERSMKDTILAHNQDDDRHFLTFSEASSAQQKFLTAKKQHLIHKCARLAKELDEKALKLQALKTPEVKTLINHHQELSKIQIFDKPLPLPALKSKSMEEITRLHPIQDKIILFEEQYNKNDELIRAAQEELKNVPNISENPSAEELGNITLTLDSLQDTVNRLAEEEAKSIKSYDKLNTSSSIESLSSAIHSAQIEINAQYKKTIEESEDLRGKISTLHKNAEARLKGIHIKGGDSPAFQNLERILRDNGIPTESKASNSTTVERKEEKTTPLPPTTIEQLNEAYIKHNALKNALTKTTDGTNEIEKEIKDKIENEKKKADLEKRLPLAAQDEQLQLRRQQLERLQNDNEEAQRLAEAQEVKAYQAASAEYVKAINEAKVDFPETLLSSQLNTQKTRIDEWQTEINQLTLIDVERKLITQLETFRQDYNELIVSFHNLLNQKMKIKPDTSAALYPFINELRNKTNDYTTRYNSLLTTIQAFNNPSESNYQGVERITNDIITKAQSLRASRPSAPSSATIVVSSSDSKPSVSDSKILPTISAERKPIASTPVSKPGFLQTVSRSLGLASLTPMGVNTVSLIAPSLSNKLSTLLKKHAYTIGISILWTLGGIGIGVAIAGTGGLALIPMAIGGAVGAVWGGLMGHGIDSRRAEDAATTATAAAISAPSTNRRPAVASSVSGPGTTASLLSRPEMTRTTGSPSVDPGIKSNTSSVSTAPASTTTTSTVTVTSTPVVSGPATLR